MGHRAAAGLTAVQPAARAHVVAEGQEFRAARAALCPRGDAERPRRVVQHPVQADPRLARQAQQQGVVDLGGLEVGPERLAPAAALSVQAASAEPVREAAA